MKKFALAAAAVVFAANAGATLVTMDFEQFPVGGVNGALVSDGFVLDPGAADWTPDAVPYENGGPWTGHYHIGEPNDFWQTDRQSKFFVFDYFLDSSILNIRSLSGGVFGVQQFDLATTQSPALSPIGVTFTGYLADGGTITRRESFDMFGDDGIAKFKTYSFDDQWNRLSMFTIVPDHEYANPGLDNLVLRKVPEPGTFALVGLALAGLTFSARRNRAC